MEYRSYYLSFLLALFLSCPYSSLLAQNPPYKAVNLGNWLLAEGWMKPSLFEGIVNKDLLVRISPIKSFHIVRTLKQFCL